MDSQGAKRLPVPVEGVDVRTLPIGPEEAFILSRVDGQSTESDIIAGTGLETGRVVEILNRLVRLGAIRFRSAGERTAGSGPSSAAPSKTAAASANGALSESEGSSDPTLSFEPKELEEPVDIDQASKRKILETFKKLDQLTYYELLGVKPSADKKAIKSAYYDVVNVLHPDRYFGKNLGTFKTKLERVFTRLTLAYDTLSRKNTREEYDAYLLTQTRTQRWQAALTDAAHAAEVLRIEQAIEHAARASESAPLASSEHRVSSRPPSPTIRASSVRPAARTSDPDIRRRALARKLTGTSGNFRTPSVPPVPPPSERPSQHELQVKASSALRRHFEDRAADARMQHIRRYLSVGERSMSEGDPVSAMNAFRIAASLAPEDAGVRQRLAEASEAAAAALADSYLEQARYEEREGRLSQAAVSYERAARGKQGRSESAALWERAAHCLLESGGDPKVAVGHAKKAVAAAPSDALLRLTLARAYAAAHMRQSALGEIARAATLSPDNDTIQSWSKRLKRGEV